MPVRKLKKSYKNVTGLFYSSRLRRQVQFDSILEREFILLLDLHPSVKFFAEQPMKIRFLDQDGAEKVYVPDFHIDFVGGTFLGRTVSQPWIVETKYRRDLAKDWQGIKPKVGAGIREARKIHCTFHIISDSFLTSPALANARFLRRFANGDLPVDVLDNLVTALRRMGRASIDTLRSVTWKGGSQDRVLWTAIAKRLVLADLEQPLGPGTSVWVR